MPWQKQQERCCARIWRALTQACVSLSSGCRGLVRNRRKRSVRNSSPLPSMCCCPPCCAAPPYSKNTDPVNDDHAGHGDEGGSSILGFHQAELRLPPATRSGTCSLRRRD